MNALAQSGEACQPPHTPVAHESTLRTAVGSAGKLSAGQLEAGILRLCVRLSDRSVRARVCIDLRQEIIYGHSSGLIPALERVVARRRVP